MAILKSTFDRKKNKGLINLKVTPTEYIQIKKNAIKFTKGNMSEWIRYAAIQLKPKPCDLV